MSDKMRPIPFRKLVTWVLDEYGQTQTIFGIPEDKFYRSESGKFITMFGDKLDSPIGPAAGPNTQLAQNIIASYLSGSSFFELKTVQILDKLEFPKPCIRAEDECYNTEWSTELAIEEALAEYVKAWFMLHILQKELFNTELTRPKSPASIGRKYLADAFAEPQTYKFLMRRGCGCQRAVNRDERRFMFNMSVGYDLKGIQSPQVDAFIEGLKNAAATAVFQECKTVLLAEAEAGKFRNVSKDYIEKIPADICTSITLSTMHGCPPAEIEAISKYLLTEKKLHTFVKMNPTLLGYRYVRDTFDQMGYTYVALKEESFTHDLQYADGVAMLKRLQAVAKENGREFGVKLSNTLPTKITRGELPGEEMYMSGRSLYPLTINLALKLAGEFDGDLRISFSGGADFFNMAQIFATGIRPITIATTLLKPGGYTRLKQIASELEERLDNGESARIDLAKLQELAASAFTDRNHRKEKRTGGSRKPGRPLPLVDCFAAPCTYGCPIGQDIPEYTRLVGEGRYLEALAVVVDKNPLPFITGTICNHNCQTKCTRLDYDESVLIRDMKLLAAQNGYDALMESLNPTAPTGRGKAAVIGAGPSGLAAGYFLARAGLDVTVFDKREQAGGTVEYVIPDFRISREAIRKDIELIKRMGVKFELGADPDFSVAQLKEKGYTYIYLAIGAGKTGSVNLEGDRDKVMGAIPFLEAFTGDKNALKPGKSVAVIGGGNSAMDAARAAKRLPGVETVYIIYRRTKEFMPADREELNLALADGVVFKELLAPLSLKDGMLKCQKMALGQPDASGRRSPVAVNGEFETIPADTVLTATGEQVDYDRLRQNGLEVDAQGNIKVNPETLESTVENVYIGGDALYGPSTVVNAIAHATRAAKAISAKENLVFGKALAPTVAFDHTQRLLEIAAKKGVLKTAESGVSEAQRCLECNYVCNVCVEVCPNRANIALQVDGLNNVNQVVHVDGMCNECGNCATFCPSSGAPYQDKFTLFWSEEDFADSANSGFLLLKDGAEPVFRIRLDGKVFEAKFGADGKCEALEDAMAALVWTAYQSHSYLF